MKKQDKISIGYFGNILRMPIFNPMMTWASTEELVSILTGLRDAGPYQARPPGLPTSRHGTATTRRLFYFSSLFRQQSLSAAVFLQQVVSEKRFDSPAPATATIDDSRYEGTVMFLRSGGKVDRREPPSHRFKSKGRSESREKNKGFPSLGCSLIHDLRVRSFVHLPETPRRGTAAARRPLCFSVRHRYSAVAVRSGDKQCAGIKNSMYPRMLLPIGTSNARCLRLLTLANIYGTQHRSAWTSKEIAYLTVSIMERWIERLLCSKANNTPYRSPIASSKSLGQLHDVSLFYTTRWHVSWLHNNHYDALTLGPSFTKNFHHYQVRFKVHRIAIFIKYVAKRIYWAGQAGKQPNPYEYSQLFKEETEWYKILGSSQQVVSKPERNSIFLVSGVRYMPPATKTSSETSQEQLFGFKMCGSKSLSENMGDLKGGQNLEIRIE
ncbi:hypothetical protein M9H77_23873 [Catharanthus roseus]|uniref:Uncharacterized protein n=1 Tax=Catharanthus roseus TaxID=4058 RepID=A0ACC0AW93_CATRO|nr:hypothetical protein M9H77_23873 [Catharanthus roseus]